MDHVERELRVARPADEVWPVLVEPGALGEWLGGELDVVMRPGAGGTFSAADGPPRRLVVRTVDAPRELSFVWWYPPDVATASTVTIELAEQEGTTTVHVRESWRGAVRVTA